MWNIKRLISHWNQTFIWFTIIPEPDDGLYSDQLPFVLPAAEQVPLICFRISFWVMCPYVLFFSATSLEQSLYVIFLWTSSPDSSQSSMFLQRNVFHLSSVFTSGTVTSWIQFRSTMQWEPKSCDVEALLLRTICIAAENNLRAQ